jgi:7-dehydrocholesterol reductase
MPPKKQATTTQQDLKWGRNHGKDIKSILEVSFLFVFAPGIVMYYFVACDSFDCSLAAPVQLIGAGKLSVGELLGYELCYFAGLIL